MKIIKRSPLNVVRDIRSELGRTVLNLRTGNIGELVNSRADRIAVSIGLILTLILMSCVPSFAAAGDIIDTATTFANTYFSKIVTFSTVAAVFLTACCAIWMMIVPTSRGAQSPVDWIKRIWLCWIVINGMTAIVAVAKTLVGGSGNGDMNSVTSTPQIGTP